MNLVNPRIKHIYDRFCRKTIQSPDGSIVHHGDCNIYSLAGVCTCGLIHDLIWIDIELAKSIYPQVLKDWAKHAKGLIELDGKHAEEFNYGKISENSPLGNESSSDSSTSSCCNGKDPR